MHPVHFSFGESVTRDDFYRGIDQLVNIRFPIDTHVGSFSIKGRNGIRKIVFSYGDHYHKRQCSGNVKLMDGRIHVDLKDKSGHLREHFSKTFDDAVETILLQKFREAFFPKTPKASRAEQPTTAAAVV